VVEDDRLEARFVYYMVDFHVLPTYRWF
jgi:hypothetical protein